MTIEEEDAEGYFVKEESRVWIYEGIPLPRDQKVRRMDLQCQLRKFATAENSIYKKTVVEY